MEENLSNLTNEQAAAMVAELQKQLDELKGNKEVAVSDNTKKNHKPGKPSATRKYVLLSKELKSWGRVPQQQADIARILANALEVNKEYTESEVFDAVVAKAAETPSIAGSVQDPTYLFRHYRGLKNDGKHAGFVARDFMRVIG
jgi:hypothetical protein